ncbi:MAG TPA: hypothetical protein VE871_13285 [Longimicrobium sp.]|nr:hypothetical protein [Longimicrobium sp.]
MKLARTLLSVLTLSVLAACGDSVTAPQAEPEVLPSLESSMCAGGAMVRETLTDGSVVFRCSQLGSGG